MLAGDPKQLPPTVTSQKAILEHGLDRTLFDRICDLGEPQCPSSLPCCAVFANPGC